MHLPPRRWRRAQPFFEVALLQFAETATAGREPFEELDCDGHALASSQDFAEPQLPFCRRSPKKR